MATPSEESPRPEVRIAGYTILEEIGRGGQGVVFRARQESLDRIVAIKVLEKARLDSETTLSRFQAEARLISKLHHPNIIQAIDAGEQDDCYYFVMEYVPGESLERRLHEQGPLPEGLLVEVAWQAAQALQHAHDRGLSHGDIKPDNLILAHDGTLRVLDFGIARIVRRGQALSEDAYGTAGFVAPEIVDGRSDGDIRSDLFGLGVTLYELLTGKLPPRFHGSPLEGPDVRDRRPQISVHLSRIISRLLAHEPSARYQTPDALVKDLRRTPTTVTPPAAATAVEPFRPVVARRIKPWLRRPQLSAGVLGAALFALSVLALLVWALRSGDDADPAGGTPKGRDPVEIAFAANEVVIGEGELLDLRVRASGGDDDGEPRATVEIPTSITLTEELSLPELVAERSDPEALKLRWSVPYARGHGDWSAQILLRWGTEEARCRVVVRDRDRPTRARLIVGGTKQDEDGDTFLLEHPSDENIPVSLRLDDPDDPEGNILSAEFPHAGALCVEDTIREQRGGAVWYKGRLAVAPRGQATPILDGWIVVRDGKIQRSIRLRAPSLAAAVLTDALDWLARHQDPYGAVPAHDFGDVCANPDRCPAPQPSVLSTYDTGVTALATMAWLRADSEIRDEQFGGRALSFLAAACRGERVGNGGEAARTLYNHILALEALAAGMILLERDDLRAVTQTAVDRLLAAALATDSGQAWSYRDPQQGGDTSLTIWALRALAAAQAAGLRVDEKACREAARWLHGMVESGGEHRGRFYYLECGEGGQRSSPGAWRSPSRQTRFPAEASEALTAGSLSVLLTWEHRIFDDGVMRRGLERVRDLPPTSAPEGRDFCYWQHGAALLRGCRQQGVPLRLPTGSTWADLGPLLANLQRHTGCARGSFDPTDAWGPEGGRSYATAMLALTLANQLYPEPLPGELR